MALFTQELADKICAELASGRSLRSICKDANMPSKVSVLKWLNDPAKADFVTQYTRAREEQADSIFDELLEIADDGSNDLMTIGKGDASYEIENKEVTNRSKLRIDARKWILSKMLPKKYGDKLDVTSGGEKVQQPQILVMDQAAADALNKLKG